MSEIIKEIEIDKKERGAGLPGSPKDPEKLKEAIENIDEAIDYHNRRKELTEKQFELMIENPEPLKPNFAYEEREEWVEVAREFHMLGLESKLKEIGYEIQGLKDRKEMFEKLLEDDDNGIIKEEKESTKD